MKIVFTNCDFVLNHTKIIPFNCSNSPYYGNIFNLGVKELEIYSPNGVIPENAAIASYIGANSHAISNIQIKDGNTVLVNLNLNNFSPAIDYTVDSVTEHTGTIDGYVVRIKGNFKAVQDGVSSSLWGQTIIGNEQDGCFNWRVD